MLSTGVPLRKGEADTRRWKSDPCTDARRGEGVGREGMKTSLPLDLHDKMSSVALSFEARQDRMRTFAIRCAGGRDRQPARLPKYLLDPGHMQLPVIWQHWGDNARHD